MGELMDELREHVPSETARRRARAAGLDLDTLRREDQTAYMMLCSQPVMTVHPALAAEARPALQAALPDQQLFEAESADRVLVTAFPGVRKGTLERLDRLMGETAEGLIDRFGYYRVVRDISGERRELSLPVAPEQWSGEQTMVGPFDDEGRARVWGDAHIDGSTGLTFDAVPYAGFWFCDVFRGDAF